MRIFISCAIILAVIAAFIFFKQGQKDAQKSVVMLEEATPTANAQPSATSPSPSQIVTGALDDYATVSGGWYLEKKCHFLEPTELDDYEIRMSVVTMNLHNVLGIDEQSIYRVQAAGKAEAEKDEWACNETARQIIDNAILKVKKLEALLSAVENAAKAKAAAEAAESTDP